MVRIRVRKGSPDTRQNVKKIEFIRGKGHCQESGPTSQQSGRVESKHVLLISFYSRKTKEWSEVKISFTDWSRHIYFPSIRWEWDRPDAFPYLGQVLQPRWAQEFHNHRNMVVRAIKSPVGGERLKLFQARSSFVLEAPLSSEHHNKYTLSDLLNPIIIVKQHFWNSFL